MSNYGRPFTSIRRLASASSAAGILVWLSVAFATTQGPAVFSIDAANSRVLIEVGRSGLFGFAGHDHEVIAPVVTGEVTFNPADWQHSAVNLQFDASALKVTGKGDPPADVPKVQDVMLGEQVLDVKRFQTVAFRSRRVSATPRSPGTVDLVIDGDLTLHGQTRPMSIRAVTTLGRGGLDARGAFTIKQTDFGMTPVTAGGGTVRVKDDVRVQFDLKARERHE